MRVEYDVIPEDIISWNIHLVHVSPLMRRKWLNRRIMFICVPLGVLLFTLFLPSNSLLAIIPSLIAIPFLIAAIYGFFVPNTIISLHTKRLIRDGYYTAMGHRMIELTPDVFLSDSRFGKGSTRWSVIQRIDVTEQHLFLFVDELHAMMIPKRSFSDPSQCEAFLQLARQYHAIAHMHQI